jgi:response regulator RpfG family c-di-GMP phosphodiesterase
MQQDTQKRRLDEILLEQGDVSEAQIKIALKHQKIYGGKFGSHLMHHGFIDEAGLVKALSQQLGCDGVVLSQLEISPAVLEMIPSDVAYARKAVPFDFASDTGLLKVACENPADDNLRDELSFVVEGKTVVLFVAAESALDDAIGKYYFVNEDPSETQPYSEYGDTETGRFRRAVENDTTFTMKRKAALLVTDDENSAPLLKMLLEEGGYAVETTDSANIAIDIIANREFSAVFIKDTVSGDYLDLIDRLRKKSPSTRVRYYESAASLLLDDDTAKNEHSLTLKNLDLFTSLLTIKNNLDENHSGRVGQYADKLCRRLGLPLKERNLISDAAYLHDLAKFYYPEKETSDLRGVVKLSAKLLKSINYEPLVVEMLQVMYVDLKKKYTRRLPIEALGGNILTVVDLFCDSFPTGQRLTLDRYNGIKTKLNDQIGRLFLSEVTEAFLAVLQDEILTAQPFERFGQIMLYSDSPTESNPLELRLKYEGYRLITADSRKALARLFERSLPDMIVLRITKSDPSRLVPEIADDGVDFKSVPTFLITEHSATGELAPLLEMGIEDIIDSQANPDMLVLKVNKLRAQFESRSEHENQIARQQGGAKGSLTDMNLIDLLQALGPSKRTTKITITHTADGQMLEIYLSQGSITFAQLEDLRGAEAVYRGLTWQTGKWTVEPISVDELPDSNNQLPNESILMEGCRQMDEMSRERSVN